MNTLTGRRLSAPCTPYYRSVVVCNDRPQHIGARAVLTVGTTCVPRKAATPELWGMRLQRGFCTISTALLERRERASFLFEHLFIILTGRGFSSCSLQSQHMFWPWLAGTGKKKKKTEFNITRQLSSAVKGNGNIKHRC